MTLATATYDKRLARIQLVDVIALEVKGGLQHRAFAGQSHNLVVLIPECGAYAPWVAHGKHLATAGQSTNHVTAIIVLHRLPKHVGHLYVVIDISCDVGTLQSFRLGFLKESFHLAVQPVAHQFEGDVRVAIDTRRLALRCQELENLVDVGHVEVATQTKVLSAPIVTAQEGMDIRQTALARSRVAQMTHQQLRRGPPQPSQREGCLIRWCCAIV